MTHRHDPMTDPASLAAIDGATIPGLTCAVERGHAGTFLTWGPDDCNPLVREERGGDFYATPEWEGTEGIAVCIEREGAVYTDTLPVEWTGDGVEDAHRYLAAMRRWQRTLPTLYARWDGDPSTDFVGTVLDLCIQYDGSNIWDRGEWALGDHGGAASLLDILDERQEDMIAQLDNMVIRTTPFPVEKVTYRRVIAQYATVPAGFVGTPDWADEDILEHARRV